jgi:hypothetical protein
VLLYTDFCPLLGGAHQSSAGSFLTGGGGGGGVAWRGEACTGILKI